MDKLVGRNTCLSDNYASSYVKSSQDSIKVTLHDTFMEEATLDLATTLIDKFYSFTPIVDLVRQWASNVRKLKGNVSVSAMADALFLFIFF